MGRKRHLLVDTLGLIHYLFVHPADIQDRDGAEALLEVALWSERLEVIFADGGYRGRPEQLVNDVEGKRMEIVMRKTKGVFEVLPKRWIVERTNAWVVKYRRLRCDYEQLAETVEAFILLGMTRLMLRRMA
jgi:putative transposase